MKLRRFISSSPQSLLQRIFAKEAQLMVVSEQEGAEIFVDGESTGKFTPALLKLPLGVDVDIELRLLAHKTYKKEIHINALMTYHYCVMQREAWTVYQEESAPWHYVPPSSFMGQDVLH